MKGLVLFYMVNISCLFLLSRIDLDFTPPRLWFNQLLISIFYFKGNTCYTLCSILFHVFVSSINSICLIDANRFKNLLFELYLKFKSFFLIINQRRCARCCITE